MLMLLYIDVAMLGLNILRLANIALNLGSRRGSCIKKGLQWLTICAMSYMTLIMVVQVAEPFLVILLCTHTLQLALHLVPVSNCKSWGIHGLVMVLKTGPPRRFVCAEDE